MALRQRRQAPGDEAPDVFLDEAEQDELIKELADQSRKNARFARRTIVPLGAVLSVICTYFALQSYLDPWSVRHHAELSDVLGPAWLAAGQAGIGVAVAVASAAVAASSTGNAALERRLLVPAAGLSLLTLLFWTMVIMKLINAGEGEVWRALWLPATPLLWAAVTASTIDGLKSARKDLAALRAARYSFRRV